MNRTGYEKLEQAVFAKRPVLRNIMKMYGDKSLYEYAQTYEDTSSNIDATLKNECIAEIVSHTKKLLGESKAESVKRQLTQQYYVSTTDHLGPISHPFFVHANLLAAAPYVDKKDGNHENLIVLACGNVSLGNSSLPRSILFNTDTANAAERINLFPASDRQSPVFRFRPYEQKDIERAKNVVSNDPRHSKKLTGKITSVLDSVYLTSEALSSESYSDQITRTNFNLWKEFFSQSTTVLPDLIYLELERIVSNLLQKHHMTPGSRLHEFIFNSDILAQIEKSFDGIPSAFSIKQKKGTFLFWYFPQGTNKRIALWRKGTDLIPEDGSCVIPLEPANITRLLEQRELIPSNMLSLVTLSCYYGIKCLGGFSQVNYLTSFHEAYATIFMSEGLQDKEIKSYTQSLCGDFVISFLEKNSGELVPATGLDFVLYNQPNSWELFQENIQKLTPRESFSLMLPELYRILYAETERTSELLSVTQNDIADLFGIHQKTRSNLLSQDI